MQWWQNAKIAYPESGGKVRPGIIHRLDKDTSGLIIVAKNDKAHIDISQQIRDRQVEKTYIALVRGAIKENERNYKYANWKKHKRQKENGGI